MTAQEVATLARYNSEVARGLVHTEEWSDQMAELQRRWLNEQSAGSVVEQPH